MTDRANQTADEVRAELDAQIVEHVDGRGYTRGELRARFERVENEAHWKAPINATVEDDEAEVRVIARAIVFFTGSVPTYREIAPRRWHITAAGYWEAIGS